MLAWEQAISVALAGGAVQHAGAATLRLPAIVFAEAGQFHHCIALCPLFELPEGPFLIFIGDEFWRAFGAAEVQRPTQCVVRPGRKQAIQIQRAARLGTSAGKTLPTEGLHADHRPNDVPIDLKVTHPATLDTLGDRL